MYLNSLWMWNWNMINIWLSYYHGTPGLLAVAMIQAHRKGKTTVILDHVYSDNEWDLIHVWYNVGLYFPKQLSTYKRGPINQGDKKIFICKNDML